MTLEVINLRVFDIGPMNEKFVFPEMDAIQFLMPMDIHYWFSAGTTLGLVREPKGFIEWDTDIDIEIYVQNGKEPERIKNILEDKGYELFRIMKDDENIIQYAFISPSGIIIDFYFYRKVDEELLCVCEHGTLVMPLRYINKLELIRGYLVPSPVKDYLTFRYGDWETPIKKDRSWDTYITKDGLRR